MKTRTKITIFIPIFIYCIALSGKMAFGYVEDENDEEFILFSDGFEKSFPSDNWIIVSKNDEYTWRRVSELEYDYPDFGNKIQKACTGDYFIFTGGNKGYYDEFLITPIFEITTPPDNLSENMFSRRQKIYFNYFVTSEQPDFNLSVAVCYDCDQIENAEWDSVTDITIIMMEDVPSLWNNSYNPIYLEVDRPFRVAFIFEGNSSEGFGIDNLYLVDYYEYIDEDDLWGHYEEGGNCCSGVIEDCGLDATLSLLLMGAVFMILRRRKGN